VGYNNFSFGGSGFADLTEIVTNSSGAEVSGLSTVRNFTNNRETSSVAWNLDLKKRFAKEGHEIDIVLNSSYGRPVSYYLLTLSDIQDANPSEGSESNNPGPDNTTTASVDYVLPLKNTSTFEAGLKGTFNSITSTVGMNVYDPFAGDFTFDPLQSYSLGYTLNVYAAYLSAGFRLFDWLDFKPGARYEYSDISIDYPGASVPSYGTLVPSILLSHNFTDNKSMQFTYTRRIRRPDYGDLNPFINRSDPYNIEMGNVMLRPESGERFELSYNTGFSKGGNLRISLAQRIDSREIEDITTFYPEYMIGDSLYRNVSVRTNENIGSEYSTGLNLFTSIPVTSKFNLRSNMGLFHTYLSTERAEGSFSTGFRFRGNLNASWQLPRKFMLEFFGFWRSGGKNIQGTQASFYIYNLAFRKLFWDDKGSFGVTATNIIRRNISQVTTINTDNSSMRSTRDIPFRSFGASFTYRFGNTQSRQDRDDEPDTFGGQIEN
jgi:outer membrane receptor protein involved in Fe transport